MSGIGTSRGDFDDGARSEPIPPTAGTSSGMVFAEVAGGTAVTGASDAGKDAPIEKPDDPLSDADIEKTVPYHDTDDHDPDDVDSRD